ncbi:MAG: hypothetical protein HPY85_12815 [Anaerolineae bacterium]|nr:hypothetical protein [Anaerolineae bacterium]
MKAKLFFIVLILLGGCGCSRNEFSDNLPSCISQVTQVASVYSNNDFIEDYFQISNQYVNSYLSVELAENEMEFYYAETGTTRIILGLKIQEGVNIKFSEDYDIRYYLPTSHTPQNRCDYFEIMPTFSQKNSSTIILTGNSSPNYADTLKVYPPVLHDEFEPSYIRVVIKGIMLGEYETDLQPVGAFLDIPIGLLDQ